MIDNEERLPEQINGNQFGKMLIKHEKSNQNPISCFEKEWQWFTEKKFCQCKMNCNKIGKMVKERSNRVILEFKLVL